MNKKRHDNYYSPRSEKQRQRQLGRKRGAYIRSVESSLIQEYAKEIAPMLPTDRHGSVPSSSYGPGGVEGFLSLLAENPTRPKARLGHLQPQREHRYMNEQWDHYKLSMALIEDCLEILIALKRGRTVQSVRSMSYRGEEPEMVNREALYWFFHEVDPDGERVCSLEWCCMAINAAVGAEMSADMLRDQACRLGLYPKEYR